MFDLCHVPILIAVLFSYLVSTLLVAFYCTHGTNRGGDDSYFYTSPLNLIIVIYLRKKYFTVIY